MDVSKGTKSPSICGTVEGQNVDLNPPGLLGPRAFIASGGTLGVKLFLLTNKLQDDDMDPSRGAMNIQLSFRAVPKKNCSTWLASYSRRIWESVSFSMATTTTSTTLGFTVPIQPFRTVFM